MKRIISVCCVLLIISLGFIRLSAQDPKTAPAESKTSEMDRKADIKKAVDGVKKDLAGHEDEPAEKFYRNIEILKGKKASRLPGMMSALTGLLGVDCSYCHVPNEWAREDKPTKQTARKMFRMMAAINKDNFEGKNAVSCWTCHRGNPHPPIQG
jgi:photosynthetic reaction center cytochrome c subunit